MFSEEKLYPLPPNAFRIEVTADGKHVFWFEKLANGVRFVWDGKPGEPFDDVMPTPEGEILHWSPGRDRVAYWGVRKPGFFVGIDGGESHGYAGVSRSVPPTFSSDGMHLAFGVLTDPKTAYLVVDGQTRTDDSIAPVRAVFSPDGTRLAYAGLRLAPRPAQWIVVDDTHGPEVDGIWNAPGALAFSSDSRRFAYVLVRDKKSRMVLDGQEGAAFDYVGVPGFSPDGRRFGYAAKDGGRMSLIVDGAASDTHDVVGDPLFSADGERLAQAVVDGKRYRMIVDGEPGPEFTDVGTGARFSPDNMHFAYSGQRKAGGFLGGRTTWVLVRDGTPGTTEWDQIASEPHFSPDSQHLSFSVRQGKNWFIVVDDIPGPTFMQVSPPRFSAKGRLAFVAQTGDTEWHLVVDGELGPPVDSVSSFTPMGFFASSADGRHFAAVVRIGNREHPMVDHELGAAYDGVVSPIFVEGQAIFIAGRGAWLYRATRAVET